MAANLIAQVAVKKTGPGQYVSVSLPARMGNVQPIAYGGCLLGLATRAAYDTLPASSDSSSSRPYHLYSLVGQFLGPTSTEAKVYVTVHNTRDTKSFATRRVEMRQYLPPGPGMPTGPNAASTTGAQARLVAELLADFHADEPASLLTYSVGPSMRYAPPESLPTQAEQREALVRAGTIAPAEAALSARMFGIMSRFFDSRPCPESVGAQTLFGQLKTVETSQDRDGWPVTRKTSAEWQRARGIGEAGETEEADKAACLAFHMDGGLSLAPLAHTHTWFDDTTACSSLDFALRVFVPVVEVGRWHLRERRTQAAGGGRTYSQSRLFDEGGRMVAEMTQQCILRPAKGRGEAKL